MHSVIHMLLYAMNDQAIVKIMQSEQAAACNLAQFLFTQTVSVANKCTKGSKRAIIHDDLLNKPFEDNNYPELISIMHHSTVSNNEWRVVFHN